MFAMASIYLGVGKAGIRHKLCDGFLAGNPNLIAQRGLHVKHDWDEPDLIGGAVERPIVDPARNVSALMDSRLIRLDLDWVHAEGVLFLLEKMGVSAAILFPSEYGFARAAEDFALRVITSPRMSREDPHRWRPDEVLQTIVVHRRISESPADKALRQDLVKKLAIKLGLPEKRVAAAVAAVGSVEGRRGGPHASGMLRELLYVVAPDGSPTVSVPITPGRAVLLDSIRPCVGSLRALRDDDQPSEAAEAAWGSLRDCVAGLWGGDDEEIQRTMTLLVDGVQPSTAV